MDKDPDKAAHFAHLRDEADNRSYYRLVKNVVGDEVYKQRQNKENMKKYFGETAGPLNAVLTTAGVFVFVYLVVMWNFDSTFWVRQLRMLTPCSGSNLCYIFCNSNIIG